MQIKCGYDHYTEDIIGVLIYEPRRRQYMHAVVLGPFSFP